MTEPMRVACPNCQTYPCSNPGCLEPLQAEIKRLEAIKAELIEALQEAVYDIASWGEYADYYFQEKWDLAADISKIEAAIEKAKQ